MPLTQSAAFRTTAWSLIHAAKDRGSDGHIDAVNRFIAGYWKPVFYFIRARGYPLHRAEDLTQDFFCLLLTEDSLAPADPRRGRFRNFLLKVLTRFLSDQGPARGRKQATFENQVVAISSLLGEEEQRYEPAASLRPEDLFMRKWAHAVIDSILQRVQLWCMNKGRPDWYQIFFAEHFPEAGRKPLAQEALAQRFRVTRDQVRHALEQVKRQFSTELHAELTDQVADAADIPAEISDLEQLLGSV